MLFTEAKNLSDYWNMRTYIPEIGNPDEVQVKPWGWDASNKASLKVSTVAEILAGEDESSQGMCYVLHRLRSETEADGSAVSSAAPKSSATSKAPASSASKSAKTSAPTAKKSATASKSKSKSSTSTSHATSASVKPSRIANANVALVGASMDPSDRLSVSSADVSEPTQPPKLSSSLQPSDANVAASQPTTKGKVCK